MRIFTLIVFILAATTGSVLAQTDYVARGHEYLAEGNTERAIRMFKAAIKINVDDEAAWEGYNKAVAAARGQSAPSAPPPPAAPPVQPSAPSDLRLDAPLPRPAVAAPSPSGLTDFSSGQPRLTEEQKEINQKLMQRYLGRSPSGGSASSSTGGGASPAGRPSPQRRPPKRARVEVDDTLNERLLRSERRATKEFKRLQEWQTNRYRRESNGILEVIATYYSPDLYKLLVTRLGAKNKWSAEETRKKFHRLMEDYRGDLEFYVKLVNYTSSPKRVADISDIHRRTYLEDDRGNTYEPLERRDRRTGRDRSEPSVEKVVDDGFYTVWFSRHDSDGVPILDRAKERLYLVIEGQDSEADPIRIPFRKKQFTQQIGKKGKKKPWWKIF